jgi:TRAP-type C4-dicarboxylate transport system permease small subunit
MVMMTLLGSSSLMAKGGHLRIDYFVERVSEKYRLPVQIGGTIITAFTFFLLAVLSGRMAWDEFRYEVSSPGLGVPTWIYTIWMPVLFLAITGRAVGRIIRMRRGED